MIFQDSLQIFFLLLMAASPVFILLAVLLTLLFIKKLFLKLRDKKNKNYRVPAHHVHSGTPYELNQFFLTENEASFFRVLLPIASSHNLYVFSKPRIADFVSVTLERYVKGSQFHAYFGMISQKHIDFLLCDADFKPVLGFEVDDSTHLRPDRIDRDEFVDKLYGAVGLRVIHIHEWSNPEKIEHYISGEIFKDAHKEAST